MNDPEPTRTPPVDPQDRTAACHFLATVPKVRAVRLAARCAERLAPRVLNDHPDALERLNTVDAVVRIVTAWTNGTEVSRFTLRLARDVAYDVADLDDHAGPTLYAAAAILETDPSRSVAAAIREAHRLGDDGVRNALELDLSTLAAGQEFGPLWPDGEPDWARKAWAKLQAERPRLITVFALPPTG